MKNEIQEVLEKNGIQIYEEDTDVSEEKMKQLGYRKMSVEEVLRFSSIFQDAPEIAKDIFYKKAVQKSFDNAVKDTYRLVLDPQFHLGFSHRTPGLFSGNAFDEGNHLKTAAEWMINDSELNLSILPEIASRFFSVASLITGQYYISQINHNIEAIRTDVGYVKQFLDNYKDSKIQAIVDDLDDISKHLIYTIRDPMRISETYNDIKKIETDAKQYINFNKTSIEQEKATATINDDKSIIQRKIQSVTEQLSQYGLLVEVYCYAVLIEILLSKVTNKEELLLYRKKMQRMIDDYTTMYNSVEKWIETYLEKSRCLNEASKKQIATNVLIYGVGFLAGIKGKRHNNHSIIKMAKNINSLFNDKRTKDKHEQVKHSQDLLAPVIENESSIEHSIKSLNDYMKIVSEEIVFVKKGDLIYTNIPE